MKSKLQLIRGCLFGGACGDALGYPVEFDKLVQIQQQYGQSGITVDQFVGQPVISDDTQMTLFTASALLMPGEFQDNLWASYQDWLETQFKADKTEMSHAPVSWLVDDPVMFASREPGRTCLTALRLGVPGTLDVPINDSKGCGGVMRVAPIGLLADRYSSEDVMTWPHKRRHLPMDMNLARLLPLLWLFWFII